MMGYCYKTTSRKGGAGKITVADQLLIHDDLTIPLETCKSSAYLDLTLREKLSG